MKTLRFLMIASLAAAAANAQTASLHDRLKTRVNVTVATIAFQETWQDIFFASGLHFPAPAVVAYDSAVRTGCGTTNDENAFFCPADNRIYYHVSFLANMARRAGSATGTDGDYAPLAVLAHEFGHAVSHQFVSVWPNAVFEENSADCLAGAVTRRVERDGRLHPGDVEEAYFAFADGADEIGVPLTHPQAHGTKYMRQSAFNRGYHEGVASCSPILASVLK